MNTYKLERKNKRCREYDCIGGIVIAASAEAAAELDPTEGRRDELWLAPDEVETALLGAAPPHQAAGVVRALYAITSTSQ